MKAKIALFALAALAPARLAAAPPAAGSAAPIRAAEARLIAHLEGPDRLAYVQVRGRYAVGKDAPSVFRGVMIWRKDRDGVWRMLHEMLVKDAAK